MAITGRGQPGSAASGETAVERTEVLDVLIGEVPDGAGLLSTSLLAGAPCLVDHNPVRPRCRQKSEAIAELSHAAVVVHGNPGEAISNDAQYEGCVPVWRERRQ